ncbi:hypothetical protein GGR55DRAFT_680159 [Xylaria sp. FL0064]|nr:hypothetical protein GGR55DRAFT_680159 [Xylaria sp. FL0064]
MSSPGKNAKKPRRVSFADLNSPNIAKPLSSPQPTSTPKPAINKDSGTTRAAPQVRSPLSKPGPPPPPQATEPDRLAGLFTHTVTNTPQGLVIDGVLRPRGPTVHSHLRDQPPQSQPFPNYPTFNNTTQPLQVNMSTVGAGLMPDPNAAHYQPPVPDTTNGPFQYTYVPRSDPQYMMANGVPAAAHPGVYAPGAYQYPQVQPQHVLPAYTPAVPGAQPGMTTTPIPMMMAPGSQMPPMQAPYMQAAAASFPPAFGYPMNCSAAPNGLTYVATGIAQPTPPITPPCFPGGGMGGFEMGKTKTEVEAENQYNSLHNQMNEPQGMKPADDDGSRMYWCRELDGQWIARSRFSLDRMGNFRWYVTENGVFYAKMLPE